jgi:pimeloyl-ACP methyl ester carboxylesterase
MATHAADMLALLDVLDVDRCHLYGHSTGGIICSHMLVAQPARFRKVLMLDPVTPFGLPLAREQISALAQMKADRDAAFAGLATAAPTLFRPETLVVDREPRFAETASAVQRRLFKRLVEMTRVLSDGVWFGTAYDLGREWDTQALARRVDEMTHEHLVLYGNLDYWIPREHVERMAREVPRCRLEVFPYVGHSMCVENPLLLARVFSEYFASLEAAGGTSAPGISQRALQ